jgi:polyhydroxyalkanoate synthesis regulator phasin
VLLRMDEKKGESLTGANAHTDPLGVLVEQEGRKYFELLLPVKETRYETPALVSDAASSEQMLTRDRMQDLKDAVARIDKEAAALSAASYIPVVGRHARKVKLLAQAERRMTGLASGVDRVAYLPVDVAAGGVMRILEPEYKRDEAFTQARSYVADLVTRGELTAQEGDAVTISLEQVGTYAKDDSKGLTLSRRYAEMLRFKTGQAEVVERLLREDVEWLM